ncbi:DUF2059 domain-containing protein [soil metagenome]
MKKNSLLLLSFLVMTVAFSQATIKTDNIKKLLELTGSGNLGVQVAGNMITSFKQTYPDVPDEFWDNFKKELNADAIIDLVTPIYEKYYTETEIQQLIDFYQTALGKKVIANMPAVMQESMEAGRLYGRELGEKVYKNLKNKGYIKNEQ